MGTSTFTGKIDRSINAITHHRSFSIQPNLTRTLNGKVSEWWLPYQKEIIEMSAPFIVVEKGRRIGMSEIMAYRSVINAIKGNKNTYYSTYNFPSSKVFIRKCAKWIRAYNQLFQAVYKKEIIDTSTGINQHKIELLNGKFIEAIPDTPNAFRDKDSFGTTMIKDEAAFSRNLAPIIESVKALDMWQAGSEIIVLSTHYGDQNDFNGLVKQLRENPKLGKLVTVTFKQAVANGLYKKICELTGKVWTPEAERDYVSYWFEFYGDSAPQELQAEPRKYGGSKMFHESIFRYVDVPQDIINQSLKIRSWDFAATSKEKAKDTTFYTANVLGAIVEDTLVILDVRAEQYSPDDVEDWLTSQSEQDDPLTMFLIEEEPGSTGKFFSGHVDRLVRNRNVVAYAPVNSKVVRAMPLIAALKHDKVLLWARNREHLDQWLVKPMTDFDGTPKPLTNDVTDCVSMMYSYYSEQMADWISG